MDGDFTALSTGPREESGAADDSGQSGVAVNGVPNRYVAPDEMDAEPPTRTLALGEPEPDMSPLHTTGADDDAAMDDPLAAGEAAERSDETQPQAARGQVSAPSLHDHVAFEHWLGGDSLADLPALPPMPPDSTSAVSLPSPQRGRLAPASSVPHAPHDSGRTPATLPHIARWNTPNASHTPLPASGPAHGGRWGGLDVPHAALPLASPEASWTPRRVHTPPAPVRPASGAVGRRRLASGDWRIFLASVACALVLLALAGRLVWSRSLGVTDTSHSGAAMVSSSAPWAQIATPSPAITQPVATPTAAAPTATAPRSTPRPAPTRAPSSTAAHGDAVYPLVSSLRLSCGAPGVGLPLSNPSAVARSWSIPLPRGVVANGWTGTVSGTVAPGGKLTLFLWQAAGSQAGSSMLTIYSAGQQSTVRLSLGTC